MAVCRLALLQRLAPSRRLVELEGIGHCPQLDIPLETAQLIVGFTARDLPQAGRVT